MTNNITIGIDEVGRGPWAGPLVVGVVALDMGQRYEGLADSKTLTKHRRELLDPYIKRMALSIGLGWVNAPELDRLGMTASLKLAAERAYRQLPSNTRDNADRIIIDGNIKMLDDPRVCVLVKADAKIRAVSAASIVAKVARDRYMEQLATIYPTYGFERHVGYGTKAHAAALQKYSVIQGVHRASFAPVKRLLGEVGARSDKVSMTDGRRAEDAAADYLACHGYQVIDRNWKIDICEIDIVATRADEIFFVEVKYRENDIHGAGLDAITPHKLKQMELGTRAYLHRYGSKFDKFNPRLMAMALSGRPYQIDRVEILT